MILCTNSLLLFSVRKPREDESVNDVTFTTRPRGMSLEKACNFHQYKTNNKLINLLRFLRSFFIYTLRITVFLTILVPYAMAKCVVPLVFLFFSSLSWWVSLSFYFLPFHASSVLQSVPLYSLFSIFVLLSMIHRKLST